MVPISNAISDDVTKMELTSEEKDMLTKNKNKMYFSFLKTRRFLFSQFLCLQTMVPISNAISDDVTKMELTTEEKDMLTKNKNKMYFSRHLHHLAVKGTSKVSGMFHNLYLVL